MKRHVGGSIEVRPRRHGGEVFGGVMGGRSVDVGNESKSIQDGLVDRS